jgi:signal transduction histidine kinase
MSELINNVLDLTQARLGGGFQLNRANEGGLGPVLEQVIAEQRFARPDRAIEMECKLDVSSRHLLERADFESLWL